MTRHRSEFRASVSIRTFRAAFPDEATCLSYFFYHRHRFQPVCPRCQMPALFRLVSYRKSFISACCAAHVSITSGTLLHHTRLPVRMWYYALLLYAETQTGISQNFLARQLGIANKAAWRLADRLRTHMALTCFKGPLGGEGRKVYVDEATLRISGLERPLSLFAMSDTQHALIRIVPNRRAATLIPLVTESAAPGSIIVSDGYHSYDRIATMGFRHSRVNHRQRKWVNAEGDHTVNVELLWANCRRLMRGRSGQVTEDNLWKFLGEVMFRYHHALDPPTSYWRLISSFSDVQPADLLQAQNHIDRRR